MEIAQILIELQASDLSFRQSLLDRGVLNEGYHPEMEALHLKNAAVLEEIIDTHGFPTADKVGEEAYAAAWLVMQHAISKPDFMRKCARILTNEVAKQAVDPVSLAYLTDRIASFEGRPQRYGTQFDWDDDGQMSPNPYDDFDLVEERRKALGLKSLAAQIEHMRTLPENQNPPSDLRERNQAYNRWRKQVGWVK